MGWSENQEREGWCATPYLCCGETKTFKVETCILLRDSCLWKNNHPFKLDSVCVKSTYIVEWIHWVCISLWFRGLERGTHLTVGGLSVCQWAVSSWIKKSKPQAPRVWTCISNGWSGIPRHQELTELTSVRLTSRNLYQKPIGTALPDGCHVGQRPWDEDSWWNESWRWCSLWPP